MLSTRDTLLQPFQNSIKTEGEVSIIFIDGALTHAIRKRPSEGAFKVQGGREEVHHPSEREVEVAMAALEASWRCLRGEGGGGNRHHDNTSQDSSFPFARVDLLRSDSGEPLLSEMEVLDPELFFRFSSTCVERLCSSILKRLSS